MDSIWHKVASGFAQGPEKKLELSRGQIVILQTFWTDEDGVNVLMDAGDAVLPKEDAEHLGLAVIQLANTPPPTQEDLA
jgi:hypothetical protein